MQRPAPRAKEQVLYFEFESSSCNQNRFMLAARFGSGQPILQGERGTQVCLTGSRDDFGF
jgi:hypothetical protein